MNRAEELLRRGYFPSQLPPAFTTSDIADNLGELQVRWLINTPKEKSPECKPEIFSVARAGHQRRVTSLINPVPQAFLATYVARHWIDFLGMYRKSRLSLSHPRFLKEGDRAACIPSMQPHYEKKILLSSGYKYMLRTDISRFFPTIYTHSVPWALHGKAVSKRNRQVTSRYFGNLIDQALRQGQDGQTMGLPIGSDTSHIIAEGIATAIDLSFKARLREWPSGFRYVDDYFLFFQTLDAANAALAALSQSLKEFELAINFEKTKICSVLDISDDFWTHTLRSFEIHKDGKKQRSDINHFFELAKELARKNSDENVMAYALKRVASTLIKSDNWDCFEAHICHVSLGYPNTLQIVAQLLITYQSHGYAIGRTRLKRLLNVLILDHAPLGHHSEVAWCLWMCKELNIPLESNSSDAVAEINSSVCLLLLLDLDERGQLDKPVKRTILRAVQSPEALKDELWLLSYEAGMRGWGGCNDAHILGDKYFKELADLKISFYDEFATTSPLFVIKEGTLEKLHLTTLEGFFDRDDAEDYIEYEENDGGYHGIILGEDEDEDEDEDENEDENEDEDENQDDLF